MKRNEKITAIRLAQDYVAKFLQGYKIENSENISRLIVSDVVGMPYSSAIMKKPMLTQEECNRIDAICDRVAFGEPVQQVLGHAPFRFLDVNVNKSVLIPRPESEMLVDITAFYLKENGAKNPLIADVGTGSGCLAVSFATEIEGAEVYATDVSESALEVAKENAEKYGVSDKITFEKCSCLDNFDYFQHAKNHFSAIVSNPPYVPTGLIKRLPENVKRYEPLVALDGGPDGLEVFKKILVQARTLVDKNGLILFELHETCLEDAKQLAMRAGLEKVSVIKDLVGKDRYLACCA